MQAPQQLTRAARHQMRKMERGELTLTSERFSIAAAVRDVLQSCSMGLLHGSAGLRWVNEAEALGALPPLVEARACVRLHVASCLRVQLTWRPHCRRT